MPFTPYLKKGFNVIKRSQPKDVKPEMKERKLRTGENWQVELMEIKRKTNGRNKKRAVGIYISEYT
jgi:hypothetical protein